MLQGDREEASQGSPVFAHDGETCGLMAELEPVHGEFGIMVDGKKCLWLTPFQPQLRESWGERLASGGTNFPCAGLDFGSLGAPLKFLPCGQSPLS